MASADGSSTNTRTLQTYEEHLDRYLERSSQQPSPLVRVLLEAVDPGATVLELGSGPGVDASALERGGVLVERTDATVGFVQRLRRLGFEARRLDALQEDFDGPYDAIYANAVLLHFTAEELRTVLASALKAVKPGGVLAATLKKGEGAEWSVQKMAAPRHFTYWHEDRLARVLVECGWQTLSVTETTEAGATERWITLVARRPSEQVVPMEDAVSGEGRT